MLLAVFRGESVRIVLPRRDRVQASGACIVLLLLASAASAQIIPGSSLTLQAAMDRAFAANPTIAAARLRGAIDLASLAVAQERLNPEATVELERETPHQAFGLAVPLELGGKREKRIAVAQATLRAGEAEVAATIAQVRNDVRRAYYAVIVADARLTVLREQRDLAARARDAAQARFDAGSSPRLEVMQAELALSAAENEANAAESSSVAARTQLNALLGQPINETPPLTGAIDEGIPLASVAAVTMAQMTSTQLTVLDRQIEAQRARISLAEALRTPDLTPTATLTHDAEPEFTYGWRAGVAITLPVFTSHRAGVLVEQTTLDQLMSQRQATALKITADVTAAAVLAEAQRQLYARYRDQILPQAQQVEQTAQDAYQLGQTGIAALLQALQATRDIRLRALDAVSQFQIALADLERAIGAPLP
jgi:cobalt-zinc-cadmium efflux system outer membrane protein